MKCSACQIEITGATYLLPDQPEGAWCSTECRNSQVIPISQKDKQNANVKQTKIFEIRESAPREVHDDIFGLVDSTPTYNLNPKRKITLERRLDEISEIIEIPEPAPRQSREVI